MVDEYQVNIDIDNLEEFQCKIVMKQIDLESIIVNLLTNAFEALKGVNGSRIIKISTASLIDGYSIVVEDSGAGVPENMRIGFLFRLIRQNKKMELVWD